MKKNIGIYIGALVLVIVLGTWFFIHKHQIQTQAQIASEATQTQKTAEQPIQTGEIAEGPIAEGGLASKGVMVVALQIALKNDGFYKGPIDANFDKAVESALKLYQKAHGLEQTGAVDAATLASLEKTHPVRGSYHTAMPQQTPVE